MPGDLHFLIRSALTGVVFIVCLLAGLAVHDLVWAASCDAVRLIRQECTADTALGLFGPVLGAVNSTLLLGFAPVIGVAIHGVRLALQRLLAGSRENPLKLFADPARTIVADELRARVPADRRALLDNFVEGRDDDALFVYAYHALVDSYMIEWARRRRSYGYIGENWVWATIVGLIAGVAAKPFVELPTGLQLAIGGALTLMLLVAAVVVGREMKRNADKMELMWAYAYRDKDILNALLPGDVAGGTSAVPGNNPLQPATAAPDQSPTNRA